MDQASNNPLLGANSTKNNAVDDCCTSSVFVFLFLLFMVETLSSHAHRASRYPFHIRIIWRVETLKGTNRDLKTIKCFLQQWCSGLWCRFHICRAECPWFEVQWWETIRLQFMDFNGCPVLISNFLVQLN